MNTLRLLLVISTCAFAAGEKLAVPIPPDSEVHIQKDLAYEGSLHFDLYTPARHSSAVPVVLFMNGVRLY